jgi:putative membrane-bound dehydrogenase-like protein
MSHRTGWIRSAFLVAGLAAVVWLAGLPFHASVSAQSPAAGRPLKILFLGHDRQHHPSGTLLPLVAAPLARKGIQITHVMTPEEALDPAILANYDGLMIYANHKAITPAQEQALMAFVEGGKGVIAIHCASAMFTDSAKYIALVGGEFQRHGTRDFTAEIVKPDHPVMQGVTPFTTWDETYVHTRHNTVDRTVLMERVDAEGREPYTWVRTQGKGRVFYTAFGHDERTWSNPGFQKLLENGTLWAVGDAARTAWQALKMPEVVYVDGFNVPNYEKRDPAPKYQMPFTPADSQKFIQTPAEFDVQLFASEPDVIKPITFSFDARGRLWVIEAIDYPNRVLQGQPGEDRIKILEDTNADGRADKVTIFADHLNLATSLVFANGGVIVAAAPHMVFLQDTNGDDKADVRKILSTGWGIRDSHAGPSNLLYAPDNHIWGVVGYSGFDGEMNGKKMQFSEGVYRFKPDGSGFEHMTDSTNNTWGLGLSETFDVFGSTANNDPSFHVAIADRYFDGVEGLVPPRTGLRAGAGPGYQSAAQYYAVHYTTPYIRQVDVHGGYTAAAGHQLYTARAFPQRYWNRIAFITEPTAHVVGQGILESQGAGYVTRDGWNLMSGAEEWVAPVHAQVGPDGAVWVADWYNFIQQHNPTPIGYSAGPGNAFETSMRDRSRGRIYRVVWKNAPASRPRSLSATDTAGLLDALKSDNMLWRTHAQRLLVERGQQDVVPALIALVRNTAVDEIGTNGTAMQALWTLQGLGALDRGTAAAGATTSAAADASGTTTTAGVATAVRPTTSATPASPAVTAASAAASPDALRAAIEALKHPAAGVRKAAAMVLPRSSESVAAILQAGLLKDPDPHTRMAALLVLADEAPSPEIARALYEATRDATNYTDRWMSRALYIAAARHKDGVLTEYRGDPNAVPLTALPVALQLGSSRPDWRAPDAAAITADWKDMQAPGNWESRGLPGFDGVVWFTRTVTLPAVSPGTRMTFGRIGTAAEVWVNGTLLAPPSGVNNALGRPIPVYELPATALRAGTNRITLRIANQRNEGGFLGTPESMAIEAGKQKTSLAGVWNYRVERQTNAAGTLYTKPGELAAHLAFATRTAAGERALMTANGGKPATLDAAPAETVKPDIVIKIAVVPNQLKFDRAEIVVAPGQLVQLTFTNPDAMPHNFILGAANALPQIGAAADAMTGPDGLAQQYVPGIPEVLFATNLIDPGQSVTVQFRAPSQPGAYPYVCTFPGHWRVMNGLMQVRAGARVSGGTSPSAARRAPRE